jgi:hypothetical protein
MYGPPPCRKRKMKVTGWSAQMYTAFVKIFACVVNLFDQSIYLNQNDYQSIVNKLERDEEQECLTGIDGVWFVTSSGNHNLFLNERGKSIDRPSADAK